MRCKSRTQGLTFIELLLALAILAILMGLSLPPCLTYIDKNKLGSLTRQLVEALNTTKQLAIMKGTPHYLNIRTDASTAVANQSCWVISESQDCDCLATPERCQSNYAQFNADVDEVLISTNRPRLSFSPLFGKTNGATYRLSIGELMIHIIVSSQGRIRVCIASGESTIYAAC